MELTKERFDEVIQSLATKADLQKFGLKSADQIHEVKIELASLVSYGLKDVVKELSGKRSTKQSGGKLGKPSSTNRNRRKG